MNNLVRLIQTGYNHEEPQLHVRVAVLEDRMEKTLQILATKTELKEVEGNLNTKIKEVEGNLKTEIKEVEGRLGAKIEATRTEIQKEQKSTRNLLLSIGGGIIGTFLASNYFAGKDTQIVYAPQPLPQQSPAPSVSTISELKELRERVMEIERANAVNSVQEPLLEPLSD